MGDSVTRLALIGAATIVAGLIAGCGSERLAGNAMPGVNDGSSVPASSHPAKPTRPRELRLDGKDPCALVPRSDWARFYIEKPGKLKQNEVLLSPQCFYSNGVGSFDIILVMSEGIEAWRTGKRTAQPRDAPPVKGYPAITLYRASDKNGCDVLVDVADGQYLLATVILDLDEMPALPERCVYAHQWAESAMNTLVAS